MGPLDSLAEERGASEVFMIIMMSALLAFAGLAYDVGLAFNAQREANNVALSAARAGADAVSTDSLYANGRPTLDSSATRVARRFALASGADEAVARRLSDTTIEVEVDVVYKTVLLPLIGIDRFDMKGRATAIVKGQASS